MQKSQPLLSSSTSRALSSIILNLGYATCIHSVPGNISLAVPALTELLTSTCINCIFLSLSSPESFPYHTPPVAQMHTSPTDMWSVAHNSSQHLSCFPKPKSKSSDQACCRVRTQSTLKKSSSVTRHCLLKEISPLLLQNTAEFLNNLSATKNAARLNPSYCSSSPAVEMLLLTRFITSSIACEN